MFHVEDEAACEYDEEIPQSYTSPWNHKVETLEHSKSINVTLNYIQIFSSETRTRKTTYTKKQENTENAMGIEMVQRTAARWITNDWNKTTSVSSLLRHLNWRGSRGCGGPEQVRPPSSLGKSLAPLENVGTPPG